VALSLPLLEVMGEKLAWAGALPKRLVFFSVPLGFGGTLNNVDPFWPTGTETQFTLGSVLSPLAPHQADLLVVRNLAMKMGTGIQGHNATVGQLWAGVEGVNNAYPVRPEAGQPGNGMTIDHYIAGQLAAATPFSSIYLRAGSNDGFPCSYQAADTPFQPTVSPRKALNDLFANFNPGTGPQAMAAQKEAARKKSILDAVKGDYARLIPKLGMADQQKLDAHLTAIGAIEQRLATMPSMACTVPNQSSLTLPSGAPPLPTNGDWGADKQFWMNDNLVPQASDLHIQVLTAALACDLTRVAVLETQCYTQNAPAPWLGVSNLHNLSHSGDPVSVQQSVTVYNWYAGQFAKLIASLKAVPEGNGTLFDNTAVVWIQELSCGNHDMHDQPILIAGSCGGYFRTGRFVSFPGFSGPLPPSCCGDGSNAPGQRLMNDLHLTLIAAMGLPPPSGGTFGRPEWCQGVLPGLS
jgi:hypothetical protein